MRRLIVYALLAAGGIIFAWPFLWMFATSAKTERELFTARGRIFPQWPHPPTKSPYIDSRPFAVAVGGQHADAVKIIEARLPARSTEIGSEQARDAMARGIYERLLGKLPAETWTESPEQLRETLAAASTPELIENVSAELRRAFCLGQLRARSADVREDQLVAPAEAARRWDISGPGELAQGTDFAELHYDFTSARAVRLSQTFITSFPMERLRRLELYFRPDDSWHALRMTVETLGRRHVAERPVYLNEHSWQTATWQLPLETHEPTRIKTWTALQRSGASEVHEANEIKITLELHRSSALAAGLAKLTRNYRLTLDYIPFWRYVGTSLFLVVLNVIGTLFSCSVAAYAFARLQWPGRGVAFAALLGTMMLPAQVTMIPQFLIMQKLGWYNTLKPLWVLSFFGSGFSIFLLRQFLKNVPRDLEDAARLDGCGFFRIYWHIMLPLVRPTLAAIAIFTFLATWNEFMAPLIYLNDQRLYPLSFGLYAFQIQSLQPGTSAGIGMLMAGSLLMMVPVIAIFFFAQRYFLQGVALTGMKG